MIQIDSKMTVSELLSLHPPAIAVFIKRKMCCVGCPTETFHTVEDIARINSINLKCFLKEIEDAICPK